MEAYNQAIVVVSVLVGILIVISITDSVTTLTSVTNETITLTAPAAGTTVTLAHTPLDGTALVIKNISNGVALGNPQNFTYVASTGVITFNASVWGNVTGSFGNTAYATYQYQPSGYFTDSTNRTIAGYYGTLLLLGLFALIGYSSYQKYR